jgi:P-type Ca2+ transporter type 2C
MRSLQLVWEQLPSTTSGLSAVEVELSRNRFGWNRLTPLPREPVWRKFLEKFDDPIIKILLAASLLKIVIDVFDINLVAGIVSLSVMFSSIVLVYLLRFREWLPTLLFSLAAALFLLTIALGHPSIEGLAVMVAVGLATGVSFLAEYRSDREFDKLNSQKDSIRVRVRREGMLVQLPLEEVVVGDRIILETGDEIPGDGRVVLANELLIDQSLMTGESEAVRKSATEQADETEGPDKPACLYRGTQVVEGLGEMVVTNVGDDTMIGQIARRLAGQADTAATLDNRTDRIQKKLTLSKESTPLQERLERLAGLISKIGYSAAILIFIALVIRGAFLVSPAEVYWPEDAISFKKVGANLLGYLVYMVIIVVVAVPEGLPMSVTVSLALAMRKMTRANSLVRQLVACETIGSATVICTDKTGTLTQNKMHVMSVNVAGEVIQNDPEKQCMLTGVDSTRAIDLVAINAAVNSTATIEEKDSKALVIGNSTEGALLHWLHEQKQNHLDYRSKVPVIHRFAFSSEHKRMTTLASIAGTAVSLVKGAPEVILQRSNRIMEADGTVRPMLDEDRKRINEQLQQTSGQAMRTLAFAHKTIPSVQEHDFLARKEEFEQDLIFTGFVAIRDPLRPDVKEAIDRCRDAGIEVKMITGDNVETARAIAREIGLLEREGSLCLVSEEFNKLNDTELKELMPRLRVLARARPLDKYRMVRLLQEQNHVVAMTGDGTNDAPSLKKADVGLAMGIAGTEVAKEASKIVLLDDSFATIVKAVHWGRALYENIQRFVQFQLTINVSALVIAFLCPLLIGFEPPFTVLQLLWINVIMDTFAAIALCSEPPREGLMRQKPKRREDSIITLGMRYNILGTAAFFVVVMLGMLYFMGGSPDRPGWFASGNPQSQWLARDGVDKEMFSKEQLMLGDSGKWYEHRADGSRRQWDVHFTVYQATLFFTVYVFFQVWNQINCRSLTPSVSGLTRLWQNPNFVTIGFLIVLGQFLIVTFGGKLFDVEPLPATDWLWIALATMSVLIFAEFVRLIRNLLGGASRD